jgi:tetratricopeptide (TPR) repeat protein
MLEKLNSLHFFDRLLVKLAWTRHIYAGNIFFEQGQFKQAIILYGKAIKIVFDVVKHNYPEKIWTEGAFIVNQNHCFVYSPIPKVACTSLKLLALFLSDRQKYIGNHNTYFWEM